MRNILKVLGVSRDLVYTILARLWGMASGLIVIFLVAHFFNRIEQGYYYTFSSLLALQVFFELGLSSVIVQFSAHEFAFLRWSAKGLILGPSKHRGRVLDLFSSAVRWYAISSVILILILSLGGAFFFRESPNASVEINWLVPWGLAVVGLAANLTLIPFFALMTGGGLVGDVSRLELFSGLLSVFLGGLTIAYGGGLYLIFVVSATKFTVNFFYLVLFRWGTIRMLFQEVGFKKGRKDRLSWWDEVWPMQWRIALSWLSGYFIFQLFVPVLFSFHGPEVAGRMGMTVSAANAVQSIGLTWINIRIPEFCRLIASKEWARLRALFRRVAGLAVGVTFVVSMLAVFVLVESKPYTSIGERLLPPLEVGIMLLAASIQVLITAWAVFMRSFKQEPMLVPSVIGALLTSASTIILGELYSSYGMVLGYFCVSLLYGIGSTYLIWLHFVRKNCV